MGCGCGGGVKKQAMQMKLSGEMVLVAVGSGVTRRMVFRTAQRVKIMLDPRTDMRYCVPREDLAANPTIFVEVGLCN